MKKQTKPARATPSPPPKSLESSSSALEQTIARASETLDRALSSLDKRISSLAAIAELDRDESSHLAWLAQGVARVQGELRKLQEQEQRRLAKLSPAIVLAYLRQLEPEQRSRLLREAQNIDAGGSVLG